MVFSQVATPRVVKVGALKSNLGHTEATAGLCGLIKSMLMQHHCTAIPNLHLIESNPNLGIAQASILLTTEVTLTDTNPRGTVAGVSAFGFSGTNAHSVLETALLTLALMKPQQNVQYRHSAFAWWQPRVSFTCKAAADSIDTYMYGTHQVWMAPSSSAQLTTGIVLLLDVNSMHTYCADPETVSLDTSAFTHCIFRASASWSASADCIHAIQLGQSMPPNTRMWICCISATQKDWINSGMQGVARSITLERPQIKCSHVVIHRSIDFLLAFRQGNSAENSEMVIGSDYLAVTQLQRSCFDTMTTGQLAHNGSNMISGGTGGLGLLVGLWLIGHGTCGLQLLSRSGSTHSSDLWTKLCETRASVTVGACDISACIANTHSEIRTAEVCGPSGIVHAAGVDMHVGFNDLSHSQVNAVLGPKIDGVQNLHCDLLSTICDFFMVFSSAAAVFGLKSGLAYSSANSFLDSFAVSRLSAGLAAQSVQWGAWCEIGYVAELQQTGYVAGGIATLCDACSSHVYSVPAAA